MKAILRSYFVSNRSRTIRRPSTWKPRLEILEGRIVPSDNAQFISESVPPNTQESAGASFTEVVTMKNTGTSTWSGGVYGYTLNRSGSAQFGESTFYVVLDQSSVSPGALGTFTMHLTAPTT